MKAATAFAVTGAVLVAAAGGWWAWSQASADAESATERRFVSPERRSVAATVLATGVVRLRVGGEVRVGAQLSGIVDKLNVEVGSKVRRGDIIATIDSKGLEARLAQAQAQVAVTAQEVRRAEIELVRMQRLDEQKLVAANDVEDRALALDEARARLEKARRDAAVVKTDLGYAVIRSPITGTVAAVTTQEGETVAASFTTPTFATIIEDGALELIAMVDETDIGNVRIDNPVRFTVEAYPAEEFEGHVVRIAPKGTIISGVVNFEVMIRIDSPAQLLKPDMTANVSIRTAEREALVVPNEVIQRDRSERFVFVDRDGELQRQPVIAGTRDAAFTEVIQGVQAGDRILVRLPSADATSRQEDNQ